MIMVVCLSACAPHSASRDTRYVAGEDYIEASSLDSRASESGPVTLMTKDEMAMLQSFFTKDEIPDKITTRQEAILTEYRYLRMYLRETYHGTEFKSPRLSPYDNSSGSGNDAFFLAVGADDVYRFEVSLDTSTNACAIVRDDYGGAASLPAHTTTK